VICLVSGGLRGIAPSQKPARFVRIQHNSFGLYRLQDLRQDSAVPGQPGAARPVRIAESGLTWQVDHGRRPADRQCLQPGRVTAALKPVPGTKTTRVRPVPPEVRLTWPALVSLVAVVSGKVARAMASAHHCRTAC
jgi:hypothetical protein